LIDATPEMKIQTIPDGTFLMAMNADLIQTSTSIYLIETTNGRNLVSNLAFLGITPDDINDIFMIHIHGDHIGGLLSNNQKVSSNAKVYVSEYEQFLE
jgi:metal-dependent hydrolase (beta-lactamase superfamily II)